MNNRILVFLTSLLLLLSFACGGSADKEIKSGSIGNLAVTLSSSDGKLDHGNEEFLLTFKDSSGKLVDVGSVSLNFHMPAMGTMPVMNNPASFTTTDKPGVYRGKANIEMAGEWEAQIAYEGPAGKGKGSIPVIAQ
jgi:hypothetical protein